MKEKHPCCTCVLSDAKASGLKYSITWVRNYLFLNNYDTSEGADSRKVLHYQQLSIDCYQVFMLTIILSNYQ